MPIVRRPSSNVLSLAVTGACGLAALTGCGLGTVTTSPIQTQLTNVQVTGRVMGGQQPIGGATINIYQTGSTGYGAGSTLVATTTSSSFTTSGSTPAVAGGFNVTIPAVSCPNGPFFYATATGGDPTGQTLGNLNQQIVLVSMFDTCSGGGAPTFVAINEPTTIAAAYALRNFTTDSNGVVSIGAPATNSQGLRDAVANSYLLVNPSTGVIAASTPTMTMPTNVIGTLADILASCVNTTNASGVSSSTYTTACKTLFGQASLPAAPTDTFQTALNIAQFPGNNVAAMIGDLGSGQQPYTALSAASSTSVINDLSLGIVYPQATLGALAFTPVGLTIDNSDDVVITGAASGSSTTTYQYLGEIPASSVGGGYGFQVGSTAAFDGTHTVRYARFDGNGNLFMTDKSATGAGVIEIPTGGNAASAIELTTFTGLSAGTGTSTLDPNDYDLTIDASGNVWTASYGAQGNCYPSTAASKPGVLCEYVEYTKGATAYTPTNVFNSAQQSDATVRSIASDDVSTSKGVGTIWSANYGNFNNVKTVPGEYGSTVTSLAPGANEAVINVGQTNDSPFGITTDAVGGAYVTTEATLASSGLWYVPQGTANGASITAMVSDSGQTNFPNIPTITTAPASSASAANTPPVGGFNGPGNDIVDGAGNVWVANYGYGTVVEYNPTAGAYFSPYYGYMPAFSMPQSTANITAYSKTGSTSGAVTFTANNSFSTGQSVTISGLGTGINGTYTVLAAGLNATQFEVILAGAAATTANGTAVGAAYQTFFTCAASACAPTPTAIIPSNNPIAVDRTGTVWTMDGKGTLMELIGIGAPTNPVNANGQTGMLP